MCVCVWLCRLAVTPLCVSSRAVCCAPGGEGVRRAWAAACCTPWRCVGAAMSCCHWGAPRCDTHTHTHTRAHIPTHAERGQERRTLARAHPHTHVCARTEQPLADTAPILHNGADLVVHADCVQAVCSWARILVHTRILSQHGGSSKLKQTTTNKHAVFARHVDGWLCVSMPYAHTYVHRRSRCAPIVSPCVSLPTWMHTERRTLT